MAASLAASVALTVLKWFGFWLTGSVALLSDALESVVHLLAVAFAAWSLELARKPPDRDHLYGHDKVAFFSAGVEGTLVVVAGLGILYAALLRLARGESPAFLLVGALIAAVVVLVNATLGTVLLRIGHRSRNLVLVANGKHVLSDALTSGSVLGTLLAVHWTRWAALDPLVGLALAAVLVWQGAKLVRRAASGLMDESDPALDTLLRALLAEWVAENNAQYHGLRHRRSGHLTWVDVHVLLPGRLSLEEAHRKVTELEQKIYRSLDGPAMVMTHLEPIEAHDGHHPGGDPGQQHLAGVR